VSRRAACQGERHEENRHLRRWKNHKVQHAEAVSEAKSELMGDSVEDRLKALEKDDQIERLLAEMKARKAGK
jgi:hypothetical protein